MADKLGEYGFGANYISKLINDAPTFEDQGETIEHYGTPRHSGRYPWGSGKNPQRGRDLISQTQDLKARGLSKAERAKALGYSTTKLYEAAYSQALVARQMDDRRTAEALVEKHNGNMSAAAREMGRNESSLRSLLKPKEERQTTIMNSTVSILRDEMARLNGEYLDVGKAANLAIGVTPSRLENAVNQLVNEGKYELQSHRVNQANNSGNSTPLKLLVPKGTPWAEVKNHFERIHELEEAGAKVSKDDGSIKKLSDPVSLDSKRIYINYTDANGKGGNEKDGTIEIRPGVKDLNLGQSHYAQVRVLVDGDKYMKGMAFYSKNVPEGYDCIYNTAKTVDKAADVFKDIKAKYMAPDVRPIDRFGAVIVAQNKYTDDKGNEKTGVLNIMREEGEWSGYSKTLPSQFLSKQKVPVAKQQLAIDYAKRAENLEEIKNLTNPVLKQALLKPFGDECDSAAVDLKAAAFPRQAWNVLLPNPKLKDTEVYAPNFKNGEKVILVRFPHEGTYQIPLLTVNNNSRSSKEAIGTNPQDAIMVNKKVAERLSGADFDGDFVLTIPAGDGKFKTGKAVKELIEFDDKASYPPAKGIDKATGREYTLKAVTDGKVHSELQYDEKKGIWYKEYNFQKQKQMGMISNLITDMTLMGAPLDQLVRATKHSMTIIDTEKHNLDWRRSERENNIQELKNIYQQKDDPTKKAGGAGTLISRASGEQRVESRKPAYNLKDSKGNYLIKYGIDVATGKKVWQPSGKTTFKGYDEQGNKIYEKKSIMSTRMMETDDARTLMSGEGHRGTEMEKVYADYANRCKALGNEARKAYVNVTIPKRDPAMAKKYSAEVASLQKQLINAQKNIPLERLAHIKVETQVKKMRDDGKDLSASEWKQEKAKMLARARRDVGASRYDIKISDREWEAIQNNAISPTMLRNIFAKTDLDQLRSRAMPKNDNVLSNAKISRIKAYANAGMTQADIAETLGISTSSVQKALNPDKK